jgi:hypothetical protein
MSTDGSQGFDVTYDRNPAYDYILDEDSLKLYAEDLQASFGSVASSKVDTSDIFIVRAPSGKYFAGSAVTDEDKAFTDYSVEAGDRVRLQYGTDNTGTVVDAIVMDLVGTPVEASIGTVQVPSGVGTGTASITDQSLVSKKDTYYYAKIASFTEATCTFEIYDSAGTITTKTSTINHGPSNTIDIAPGIELNIVWGSGPNVVGDTIVIPFTAASVDNTKFNGLKLNKPATSVSDWSGAPSGVSVDTLEVYKSYTGVLEGVTFTATEDTDAKKYVVTATGYPTLQENGKSVTFTNNAGKLYLEYRMLVSPVSETEDLYTITSIEDIQEFFGTIAQENDIAYACACALKGAAGRPVFALRVANQTATAYRRALDKVERNGSLYSFAILNTDSEVRQAVMEYVVARSQPEMKKWCRAIFGADNPGEYVIARQTTDGKQILASSAAFADSSSPTAQILQLTTASAEGLDFLNMPLAGGTTSMYPGDKVQYVATGEMYTIAAITGPDTLILESGPNGGFSDGAIVLWKADTAKNFADYAAAIADEVSSRRCTVVWCDKGAATEIKDGVVTASIVANKYLAAEVAGIASAVVPQAPITRTEIQSIQSAARMYTKYTQLALDNIAKNGVMIITQDEKNGPCYIRHQLTTETNKGSLYYEESCTRNLDNISYAIATQLETYIGKSNVTPTALLNIKVAVMEELGRFSSDSPNDLIGPSLVNWTDLSVEQDPVFLDRVIVKVKLYLPLPLNNIKVYEMAYAAEVTI